MAEEPSFEWDEAKRLANIAKHGLDFIDAAAVFEAPYLDRPARDAPGETRRAATGPCNGRVVTVIYTRRGRAIRIISARRARNDEREGYETLFRL